MEKISVIVPCYNEEESLPLFYPEIKKVRDTLPEYAFEYILVDDGSKDRTVEIMRELAEKDEEIRYLSFSRNFGKESAMYAGLKNASGDYVVLMDADLQHPPALLPEMLKGIKEEGYDSVATRRVDRQGEPPIRSFFARQFYKLMNKISQTELVDGAQDYRMMTRQFVDSLLELSEYNRFSKGLFGWVGYKTKWLPHENTERVAGETKWSFWNLLKYSIDGIVAFSTAPLAIAMVIGILFACLAFIMVIFIVVRTLIFGDPVAGWPTLACLILLIGGVQLICIGILGTYLSKAYLEVKKRPIYIAKETNLPKGEKE
ncbi:MAG TPA: glycosyltransferase family 2 protein [Firmicutes bacterium]|nr:glycosyltransferase family 2 protein [Bacillota bacterium]